MDLKLLICNIVFGILVIFTYVKFLGDSLKNNVTLDQLWANINESGDLNLAHHHGRASLAGVYYPVDYLTNSNEYYFNNYNYIVIWIFNYKIFL